MKFRLVSICFLVLVLFNGVTGSVLAAVFCPHSPGVMTCCSAQKMEQNDQMDGMQMDMQTGMQMDMHSGTASRSDVQSLEAGSVDIPLDPCAHCITHSQP